MPWSVSRKNELWVRFQNGPPKRNTICLRFERGGGEPPLVQSFDAEMEKSNERLQRGTLSLQRLHCSELFRCHCGPNCHRPILVGVIVGMYCRIVPFVSSQCRVGSIGIARHWLKKTFWKGETVPLVGCWVDAIDWPHRPQMKMRKDSWWVAVFGE